MTNKPPGLPEGAIVTGRIEIISYLPADGGNPTLYWETSDGSGGDLPVITQLGMLELAKGYVLEYQGEE